MIIAQIGLDVKGGEDFAAGDAVARRKIRSFPYPSLSQFSIMESKATA
jgi:hypothetical protein